MRIGAPPETPSERLNRLYGELIMARRAGDQLKVDLTQKAIDDILDHWLELHQ